MWTTTDVDLLAAVLASIPAHTAVLDADGRVCMVNDAWRRFCADNDGDAALCGSGVDYLEVCRRTTGPRREEALAVADGIAKVLDGSAPEFRLDYDCSSPSEMRWFQLSAVPLNHRDGPSGAVVSHNDITARKVEEAALLHEATHDGLTGLLNRSLLTGELRRVLEAGARASQPTAVLYLDLDGFKTVNDSLGHRAGDDLLRVSAGRLRAALRPGDHLARVGGDEFVAVLPGVGLGGARRAARRVAAALAEPVELDGLAVAVTASIGIAVSSAGAEVSPHPDALVDEADAAMYQAKQRGRARTEVFRGDLRARAEHRATVEHELLDAMRTGELQLFRQPVVRLSDGAVVGGEALLRWFTPDGGLHAPETFLDLTGHSRALRVVTRSVLLAAARAAAADGSPVSVNLGRQDLRSPGLAHDVSAALELAGQARLTLEVDEQAVQGEAGRAHRQLAVLRALGARVSLDHVGSVPGCLQLYTSLPLDELKLDRTVTAQLARRETRAVVRALAGLAADLGLPLVAGGVEADEQARALQELGVDRAQGWRLGPPAPWTHVEPEADPELEGDDRRPPRTSP